MSSGTSIWFAKPSSATVFMQMSASLRSRQLRKLNFTKENIPRVLHRKTTGHKFAKWDPISRSQNCENVGQ